MMMIENDPAANEGRDVKRTKKRRVNSERKNGENSAEERRNAKNFDS